MVRNVKIGRSANWQRWKMVKLTSALHGKIGKIGKTVKPTCREMIKC